MAQRDSPAWHHHIGSRRWVRAHTPVHFPKYSSNVYTQSCTHSSDVNYLALLIFHIGSHQTLHIELLWCVSESTVSEGTAFPQPFSWHIWTSDWQTLTSRDKNNMFTLLNWKTQLDKCLRQKPWELQMYLNLILRASGKYHDYVHMHAYSGLNWRKWVSIIDWIIQNPKLPYIVQVL